MMKKMLAAVLVLLVILAGCAANETVEPENRSLRILVTRDYGREILAEKTADVFEGSTIMDLMQDNFNIETAYGGGFVNSIDGLKSGYTGAGNSQKMGTKKDWFYYVDGVMAEVGADQYMCGDANTVSWDYHDWGGDMYVKTRINAWPERLAGRKIEMAYGPGFEKDAGRIREAVEEIGAYISESKVESLDMEDLEKDALFVGSWEDANKNEFIRDAFENRGKAGIYSIFNEKGLTLYDNNDQVSATSGKGAIVASMQKAYGSRAAILLIIGNDSGMVEKAVNAFLDGGSVDGAFGIAVTEEGVCYVP